MKIVWQAEAATVREVYEALRHKKPVAYTTVLTMMKVLEQKGYVRKTQVERAFVYRPTRPRTQVLSAMVREFVDRVFDGASRPMLLHLAKSTKLSDKERKAIMKAIEEVEE